MLKVLYFTLFAVLAVLFNACSLPEPMAPQEINKRAIPPSKRIKLFSPPPNGYARIIMYRDYVFRGGAWAYNIYAKYNYMALSNDSFNDIDIKLWSDMPLCRMSNNSSCITNVRAGKPITLIQEQRATALGWVAISVVGVLTIPLGLSTIAGAAVENGKLQTTATFTPKNQHIYCIDFTIGDNFRQFKDGRTCLKEYKAIYKPKHRKEQDEWFNELLEDGDERAYKE